MHPPIPIKSSTPHQRYYHLALLHIQKHKQCTFNASGKYIPKLVSIHEIIKRECAKCGWSVECEWGIDVETKKTSENEKKKQDRLTLKIMLRSELTKEVEDEIAREITKREKKVEA